jgi:hypothetical protein
MPRRCRRDHRRTGNNETVFRMPQGRQESSLHHARGSNEKQDGAAAPVGDGLDHHVGIDRRSQRKRHRLTPFLRVLLDLDLTRAVHIVDPSPRTSDAVDVLKMPRSSPQAFRRPPAAGGYEEHPFARELCHVFMVVGAVCRRRDVALRTTTKPLAEDATGGPIEILREGERRNHEVLPVRSGT